MEIREYREYRKEEIAKLYASVGWTAYTDDLAALERGFAHSLLVLAAYDGEELLGILRAVGDGETIVFIQDILVFPAQQRKGVGDGSILQSIGISSAFRAWLLRIHADVTGGYNGTVCRRT